MDVLTVHVDYDTASRVLSLPQKDPFGGSTGDNNAVRLQFNIIGGIPDGTEFRAEFRTWVNDPDRHTKEHPYRLLDENGGFLIDYTLAKSSIKNTLPFVVSMHDHTTGVKSYSRNEIVLVLNSATEAASPPLHPTPHPPGASSIMGFTLDPTDKVVTFVHYNGTTSTLPLDEGTLGYEIINNRVDIIETDTPGSSYPSVDAVREYVASMGMTFDYEDGVLVIKDKNGNIVTSVDLPTERITASMEYTHADGKLTATRDDGTTYNASLQPINDDIASESVARASEDTKINARIDAEETARANEDASLSNRINTEKTEREGADATLGTRIDAEVTARVNADAALGTRIDDAETIRASEDSDIRASIAALTTSTETEMSRIDASAVHKTGDESITGVKTFKNTVYIGIDGAPNNLTIAGNITIKGDIIQNGTSYITHAENINTTKDVITLRDGAMAGLLPGVMAGLVFKKYDGTYDGVLMVDSTGTARVGDTGDTQPLLTRMEITSMTSAGILAWDASNYRAYTRLLTTSDIPVLDASKITTGTFADARIPVIAISKITGLQTALDDKVVKNTAITGATKCKITYDSKGLVTAGTNLSDTDIPSLSISKIINLDTTIASINTAIETKITANTAITGATKCKITYDSKGLVTAGGDLTSADIPTFTNADLGGIKGSTTAGRISANADGTGSVNGWDGKFDKSGGIVSGLLNIDYGNYNDFRLGSALATAKNMFFMSWEKLNKRLYTEIQYHDEDGVYRRFYPFKLHHDGINQSWGTITTRTTPGNSDIANYGQLLTAQSDVMTSVANTYARADAVGTVNGIAGLDATGKVPTGQLPARGISDVTGLTDALNSKINTSAKGVANGVASLDVNGKVPSSQIPAVPAALQTFTNSALGGIKGSTTAGRISANADGTGSVNGWDGKQNIINPRWTTYQFIDIAEASTRQNISRLIDFNSDIIKDGYITFNRDINGSIVSIAEYDFIGPQSNRRLFARYATIDEGWQTTSVRATPGSTDVVNYSRLLSAQSDTITTVANTYARADAVGVANGIASLDSTGKVPVTQIPIFSNSALGGIKGSTTAGRISANADGTGSVNGWDGKANTNSPNFTGNLSATRSGTGYQDIISIVDGIRRGLIRFEMGSVSTSVTLKTFKRDNEGLESALRLVYDDTVGTFATIPMRVSPSSSDIVNYARLLSAQSEIVTTVANTYARADAVGTVNGIAGLDATGKVPVTQIPIFSNSALGGIKGSTTAGRISANADGTGSVNGWDGKANLSGATFTGDINIYRTVPTLALRSSLYSISDSPAVGAVGTEIGALTFNDKNDTQSIRIHHNKLEGGDYSLTIAMKDVNNVWANRLVLHKNYLILDTIHPTPGPTHVTTYAQLLSAQSDIMSSVASIYARADAVGVANGIASLDANGKVPVSQLPENTPFFSWFSNDMGVDQPISGVFTYVRTGLKYGILTISCHVNVATGSTDIAFTSTAKINNNSPVQFKHTPGYRGYWSGVTISNNTGYVVGFNSDNTISLARVNNSLYLDIQISTFSNKEIYMQFPVEEV